MSYLDKITVGETTYDIQDTAAQGDIAELKDAAEQFDWDKPYDMVNGGSRRITGSGNDKGKTSSNGNFKCYKLRVDAGDVVTVKAAWPVTTSTTNGGVLIAFYSTEYDDLTNTGSSDDVILVGTSHNKSDEGTTFTEAYTAPAGTKSALVCGSNKSGDPDIEVTKAAVYGIADIRKDIGLAKSIIAPVLDSMVADEALSVNDFRIVGNTLYKITADIASGGTLTVGTNCEATTLAEQISAILNA